MIVLLVAIAICLGKLFQKSYTDENMMIIWSDSNRPLVISGEAYDKDKKPIANLCIDAVSSSGSNLIYTDNNGEFSENIGEQEMIRFKVGGKDIISRPSAFGISTSKGIHFKIEITNPSELKYKTQMPK